MQTGQPDLPTADERQRGLSVSDRDTPLTTVRSATSARVQAASRQAGRGSAWPLLGERGGEPPLQLEASLCVRQTWHAYRLSSQLGWDGSFGVRSPTWRLAALGVP